MERIVIELDDAAARKWWQIPQAKRDTITAIINRVLKTEKEEDLKPGYALPSEEELQQQIESLCLNEPSYQKLLEEGRAVTAANGLTQELLDKLLAEDD